MNINNLYYFAGKYNLDDEFDESWSELEDVMRENGESIEDLDWDEEDTFYVDFVYDYLEAHINDFEAKFNNYMQDLVVEQEIKKQVG